MEVTMSNACGRCKKTESRPVQIDEVIEARERQDRQKTIETKLDAFLNQNGEIALDDCPQLILLVKTSGGIRMRTLDNLCTGGEGKRKGCEHRIASLLSEIFMDKKKEKKSKKSKSSEASKE